MSQQLVFNPRDVPCRVSAPFTTVGGGEYAMVDDADPFVVKAIAAGNLVTASLSDVPEAEANRQAWNVWQESQSVVTPDQED